MAYTVADALTMLSRRLGENNSSTSANEQARRISYIAEGYRKLINQTYFWFLEASTTFDSVADKKEYTTADGFPSDYRDMVELRVDGALYTPIPQSKVFGLYNEEMSVFNYDNLITDKHYYIYGGNLIFLPATPDNGTDNISMKYIKYPTVPSSTSSTFAIPDYFIDGVVAYAYGRMGQVKGDRAMASDGFTEFEEFKGELMAEHNKRKFYNKSARPTHPSYVVD